MVPLDLVRMGLAWMGIGLLACSTQYDRPDVYEGREPAFEAVDPVQYPSLHQALEREDLQGFQEEFEARLEQIEVRMLETQQPAGAFEGEIRRLRETLRSLSPGEDWTRSGEDLIQHLQIMEERMEQLQNRAPAPQSHRGRP